MTALPGTTGRRRLYLMRHGHVDYFGKEIQAAGGDSRVVPLTPRGRKQAIAAGQALSHVKLDRALCSGVPRTRGTAELVLEMQDNPAPQLEVDEDLIEIHGGRFGQVKSRDDVARVMTLHFERAAEPGARMMEGGELFDEAQRRSVNVIKRLLAEPDWHTALIAAHEGINRLILSWAVSGGLSAASAFEQDTACINMIDFDMVPLENGQVGTEIARIIVKAVNVTPYNYVKHGMNMTSLESIFAKEPA